MATAVGLRQISLTQLNLPTPKTPCLVQESGTSPIEAQLQQIFSYNLQIFVTVATRVGLGSVYMTPLNSLTPKTPCSCKNQEHISYRSWVVANFLLKFSNFRYLGNRGWSKTNFAYTVKFAYPENPLIGATIGGVSSIQAELLEILCLITRIDYDGNKGWSGVILNDTIKLADLENPRFVANTLYVFLTMPKL